MVVALLDGSLHDPGAPLLWPDDLGVQRGDGVFETVLVVDGRPRELPAHLERLARSAAMLELPEPDRAGWHRAVDAAVAAWTGGREMALKLIMTRGRTVTGPPTAYALGSPVPPEVIRQRVHGVTAVTLDRGTDPDLAATAPWLLLGAKTMSYAVNMAAQREALRRGADDVIFVTASGAVLEGSTSTVVVAHTGPDGVMALRTPPSSLGILPGITQATLFRAAARAGLPVTVRSLRREDLFTADGVWLLSSVRLLARVRALDGKPLPSLAGDGPLRELLDVPR